MISGNELRKKTELLRIPDLPGYYKWWAKRTELDVIMRELGCSFVQIAPYLETKNDYYCIYIGIAVNESVRSRLNWHVNDSHSKSRVLNGTLSTLRQSISSIVAHNQFDKDATNAFMDKLLVEYFPSSFQLGSSEANSELHTIERTAMEQHLYILNIQENYYPQAINITRKLKALRKASKHNID